MTIPNGGWDETKPAGSRKINLGDNDIRETKAQVREVVAVDHEFASSGTSATAGQHKQVTLQESDGTAQVGSTGVCVLVAQTISGKPELVYTDEDDNDVQLTSGGETYPGLTPTLANWIGVLKLVYPVGSIYANASDSTNPGTLLGFGTWVAIEEEVIAGYKAGGTFDPVGSLAAGEEAHTLTEAEMPSHTHTLTGWNNSNAGTAPATRLVSSGGSTANATSSTGSGSAHNNIQPTYVAYLWRRTV